jgi:hypothetical protein
VVTLNEEDHVEDLLIDYQPTERSVQTAMISGFGFWKSAGWMALSFGGLMAFTEVSSVDWASQSSIISWLFVHVLMGAGFGLAMSLAFRILLLPLLARNTFRKNRSLFGPSTLRANNEGLTFKTPNTSAAFRWAELRGYKVVKDALVFQSGTARFAVPTQQMPAGDLEALHRLIDRHLSKSTTRTR